MVMITFYFQVFPGNKDGCTPVTNILPKSVTTNYLRLIPLDYNGRPALRMEVLGLTEPTSPTSGNIFDLGVILAQ